MNSFSTQDAPGNGKGATPECSTYRISTWVCLFFFFAFAVQTATAQTWTGSGAGTEIDPYRINDEADLAELATIVNNDLSGWPFWNKYFRLENDLNLGNAPYNVDQGWVPIGKNGAPFSGFFDGNGHVIRGLYINRPDGENQGLFGAVAWTTIKRLGVENVNVTGYSCVGGLFGRIWREVTVEECYSTGQVSSVGATNHNHVGGLIGDIAYGPSHVKKCYSTASVYSGANGYYAGGLVGTLSSSNDPAVVSVTNSYATGDVTNTSRSVGGLVGNMNHVNVSITNCYATGKVTCGGDPYGGDEAGGLVGRSTEGTITNCYATGAVIGINDVGGIAAGLNGNTITIKNCVALNPSVKGSGNAGRDGRIIGNAAGAVLNSNKAWAGMLNFSDNTTWDDALKNGTEETTSTIRAANFFQGAFTGDVSMWSFAPDKLPGLNGAPVELPDHLGDASNEMMSKDGMSVSAAEIRAEGFFQTAFTGDKSMWTFAPIRIPGLKGMLNLSDAPVFLPLHLRLQVQAPSITTQPESGSTQPVTAYPMTVVATSPDNGTLSYQWYSNTSNSNTGGTPINGETATTYNYSGGAAGQTYYFYVEVTNTIDDGAGDASSTAASNVAMLEVETATIGININSQINPLKAWTNNGILYISGLAEGKTWKLYGTLGESVKQGIAGSDIVTVSLDLPGVYIIRTEGNAVKVMY